MYRIKDRITGDSLYTLYCSLILPYLSYCSEVWGNTHKSKLSRLIISQKRPFKLCVNQDIGNTQNHYSNN